jgi:hypothetical protein
LVEILGRFCIHRSVTQYSTSENTHLVHKQIMKHMFYSIVFMFWHNWIISNKCICFLSGWTIKMTETLHHALWAMMQFPFIFFFGWILHPQEKKIIPWIVLYNGVIHALGVLYSLTTIQLYYKVPNLAAILVFLCNRYFVWNVCGNFNLVK